jgi:hypothetical protein
LGEVGNGGIVIAKAFVRDGEQRGGVLDLGGREADFGGVFQVAECVLGMVC